MPDESQAGPQQQLTGGEPPPPPAPADDKSAETVQRLRNEAKQYRTKLEETQTQHAAALKRIGELESAGKSDVERLSSQVKTIGDELAEERARAKAHEINALRMTVATEKGLPAALARRLTGDSREDIEADADDLLRNIPPPRTASGRQITDAGQNSGGGPPGETPSEYLRKLMTGRRPA